MLATYHCQLLLVEEDAKTKVWRQKYYIKGFKVTENFKFHVAPINGYNDRTLPFLLCADSTHIFLINTKEYGFQKLLPARMSAIDPQLPFVQHLESDGSLSLTFTSIEPIYIGSRQLLCQVQFPSDFIQKLIKFGTVPTNDPEAVLRNQKEI